jgi:hypothetical protein
MKTITFVHNRPSDNDCYDEFALEYLPGLATVRWVPWREASAKALSGSDLVVCAMQDPVGRVKARAVPMPGLTPRESPYGPVLNHPSRMDNARRDVAYRMWREAGIPCPPPPQPFDRDALRDRFRREGAAPILLKDVTRQMGRGYLVDSLKRLDEVYFHSSRFDERKFMTLDFIDLRQHFADGHHRLHRYLVCGDWVLPVVLAKTRGWSCKASHMHRDVVGWTPEQRADFEQELLAFWHSAVPPEITRSVSALGLDFALVDATVCPGETPGAPRVTIWEVNPYMNLRPKEATGKRERWWPLFADYLLTRAGAPAGLTLPLPGPADAAAYVDNVRDWKGYGTYWAKARDEEREARGTD